jgi:hypothetical protein
MVILQTDSSSPANQTAIKGGLVWTAYGTETPIRGIDLAVFTAYLVSGW